METAGDTIIFIHQKRSMDYTIPLFICRLWEIIVIAANMIHRSQKDKQERRDKQGYQKDKQDNSNYHKSKGDLPYCF